MSFESFHFIRPWSFLLLPILFAGVFALRHRIGGSSRWTQTVAPHLLPLYTKGALQQSSEKRHLGLWFVALSIAIVAMAGPTFEKIPSPIFEKTWSRVFVLDMSLSMNATDVKPSRLTRASYKLRDMLSQIDEGQVALVVYSGDSFVLSPLTSDTNNVQALIPALSTSIMPTLGSRPDLGLKSARELLENSKAINGEIILITDGFDASNKQALQTQLQNLNYPIKILAVGTSAGAPIPLDSEGFVKDKQGAVVLPRLDVPLMQKIVDNKANIITYSNDDSDIESLLAAQQSDEYTEREEILQESDEWRDLGPYLLLLLLPLALFMFKPGVLVLACLAFSLSLPKQAEALDWNSLWRNADQRGVEALQNGDTKDAIELIENPAWKAAAYYRDENYDQALALYEKDESAIGHYNRGNTLAKIGRLEDALAAYDTALEQDPELEDASFNKKLVEDLLKEQEQQQEDQDQQSQDEQQAQDQQQDQQEQQQSQEKQSQQNQEQQNGQEQQQSQQNQEQQNGQEQQQSQQGQEQQGQEQQQSQQGQEQEGQEQQQSQQNQEQKKQAQQEQAQNQQAQSEQIQEQQMQNQAEAKSEQSEQDGATDSKELQQLLSEEQPESDNSEEKSSIAPIVMPEENSLSEEDRELKQWLQQIPDDPGQLLRQKMLLEARKRQRQQKEEKSW